MFIGGLAAIPNYTWYVFRVLSEAFLSLLPGVLTNAPLPIAQVHVAFPELQLSLEIPLDRDKGGGTTDLLRAHHRHILFQLAGAAVGREPGRYMGEVKDDSTACSRQQREGLARCHGHQFLLYPHGIQEHIRRRYRGRLADVPEFLE